MIRDKITQQVKDAMRAKDAVKLETLRFVLSGIKYVEIEKQRELTDAEIIDVLGKEVKKRKEAIELFRSSGRTELVSEEEGKLVFIISLLPEQMSREEVEAAVDAAIAKVGKDNMGLIMKELMPTVKGKADGKLVSDIVKERMGQ